MFFKKKNVPPIFKVHSNFSAECKEEAKILVYLIYFCEKMIIAPNIQYR